MIPTMARIKSQNCPLCITLLPGVPNKNCYSGQKEPSRGNFALQPPSKGAGVDEGGEPSAQLNCLPRTNSLNPQPKKSGVGYLPRQGRQASGIRASILLEAVGLEKLKEVVMSQIHVFCLLARRDVQDATEEYAISSQSWQQHSPIPGRRDERVRAATLRRRPVCPRQDRGKLQDVSQQGLHRVARR